MNTITLSGHNVVKWGILLSTCVFLFACSAIKPSSPQEEKLALVIGNAGYQNIAPLKNPINDARAMSNRLSELGFQVIEAYNADEQTMQAAFQQFGDHLKSRRNRQKVALFYYSGHGA